jgi:hypothetical protein
MRQKLHSEMPWGSIKKFKRSLNRLHDRLGLQKMRLKGGRSASPKEAPKAA